jgi:predicted nucleotidyltransferase
MDNIEKTLIALFGNKQEIISVHLFGSHSKGTATEKSDVDCAILFNKDSLPDMMKLIEIRELLSDTLNQDVDLVCLNTASPIICMQVYKYGRIVIRNNPAQYSQYIMDLFTDYFDLKMMRKPLEDNILKRKYYD